MPTTLDRVFTFFTKLRLYFASALTDRNRGKTFCAELFQPNVGNFSHFFLFFRKKTRLLKFRSIAASTQVNDWSFNCEGFDTEISGIYMENDQLIRFPFKQLITYQTCYIHQICPSIYAILTYWRIMEILEAYKTGAFQLHSPSNKT